MDESDAKRVDEMGGGIERKNAALILRRIKDFYVLSLKRLDMRLFKITEISRTLSKK